MANLHRSTGCIRLLVTVPLVACSVDSRPLSMVAATGGADGSAVAKGGAGGASETDSQPGGNSFGGSNSSTAAGGGGNPPGPDGAASTGCAPPCSGGTPVCEMGMCVQCLSGAGMCAANRPSKCVSGTWVPGEPCTGQTPACSNGVCAAARLTGGIVTVATGVLTAGNVRLVDHGLEYTATTCGMIAGKEVCVVGGIRP